jgi:hypothetical protein
MIRWLVMAAALLIAVSSVGAQESKLGVRNLMTAAEFKAAGLDKLSQAEAQALDEWLAKHSANVYRLAQRGGGGSGGGYLIEASVNDETFIINRNVYKAHTYCFGFERGDRVIFAEGSTFGACASAKLVNLRNGNVCDVWCE